MSLFQSSITNTPQSIVEYKGDNINIPNSNQLEDYFTKIRGIEDFIRIFLIVNYVYIDEMPIKNMFKLLYVPLNATTVSNNKRIKNTKPRLMLNEPTYISVNCAINYNYMATTTFMNNSNADAHKVIFYDDVYFKPIQELNDITDVDTLYNTSTTTNSSIGKFYLKELNKEYSIYFFKNNVGVSFPTFSEKMYAKICYNYFQDKTLENVINTFENVQNTCSVIELNKQFFINLPELNKNINLHFLDEDTIVSFIFKNSNDIYIELPNQPIEVKPIPDEPINYYPENPVTYNPKKSDNKRKMAFAEEPANELYTSPYPNKGLVFTNKPELIEYKEKLPVEQVQKRMRLPYGGTKHKKKLKNKKTKKVKKIKKKFTHLKN
jgi:hypothetical protein